MNGGRMSSAKSARGSTNRAATISRLSIRSTGSERRRASKTRMRSRRWSRSTTVSGATLARRERCPAASPARADGQVKRARSRSFPRWGSLDAMRDNSDRQIAEAEATGRPAAKRAEAERARFRVAAQRGAALAAGGAPSEAEASRMVSEFHARGGRITVCPPADAAPPCGGSDRGETR